MWDREECRGYSSPGHDVYVSAVQVWRGTLESFLGIFLFITASFSASMTSSSSPLHPRYRMSIHHIPGDAECITSASRRELGRAYLQASTAFAVADYSTPDTDTLKPASRPIFRGTISQGTHPDYPIGLQGAHFILHNNSLPDDQEPKRVSAGNGEGKTPHASQDFDMIRVRAKPRYY